MPDGTLIAVLTTQTFFYLQTPPLEPGPLTISFALKGNHPMATGTVGFISPSADTTVIHRPVSVVITPSGGSAAAPILLDCITSQTFACNLGDSITATPTGDVNSGGMTGPAGTPLTVTAAVVVTPPAPGPLTITFTEP